MAWTLIVSLKCKASKMLKNIFIIFKLKSNKSCKFKNTAENGIYIILAVTGCWVPFLWCCSTSSQMPGNLCFCGNQPDSHDRGCVTRNTLHHRSGAIPVAFFGILICLRSNQLPLIKVIFLSRSFLQLTHINLGPLEGFLMSWSLFLIDLSRTLLPEQQWHKDTIR